MNNFDPDFWRRAGGLTLVVVWGVVLAAFMKLSLDGLGSYPTAENIERMMLQPSYVRDFSFP